MRSCFLRAVLLSAAAVGIILVPALPAHAQCTHLGQQVVCPPGVSNGSTSLFFTNGGIIWQTPTGSTTSSPRAGCCPPFTAPTPTAPSATGLTPTTGAGQTAVSNAVGTPSGAVVSDRVVDYQNAVGDVGAIRIPVDYQNAVGDVGAIRIPSGAVVSDRAPREAERQYRTEVYQWWKDRAVAAEREAAEKEQQATRVLINAAVESMGLPKLTALEIDRALWEAAYYELRAREAEDSGYSEAAWIFRQVAERRRLGVQEAEQGKYDAEYKILLQDVARAQEEARAARERADAARRGAEETYRRLQEARREAERQPTEQAQPVQPVQQAQQFTVYFSDSAAGRSEYLRGYLEARPVINQSDAANAQPPAPRLP